MCDFTWADAVGTCWLRALVEMNTKCWQARAQHGRQGQLRDRQLALAMLLQLSHFDSAASSKTSSQKQRSGLPKRHARLRRRCASLGAEVAVCQSRHALASVTCNGAAKCMLWCAGEESRKDSQERGEETYETGQARKAESQRQLGSAAARG